MLIGSRFPEALNNLDSFLDCLQDFKFNQDSLILLPLSINAIETKIQSHLRKYGFLKKKIKFYD